MMHIIVFTIKERHHILLRQTDEIIHGIFVCIFLTLTIDARIRVHYFLRHFPRLPLSWFLLPLNTFPTCQYSSFFKLANPFPSRTSRLKYLLELPPFPSLFWHFKSPNIFWIQIDFTLTQPLTCFKFSSETMFSDLSSL